MKPLVELSIEHHELLLKYANESSPLYFRLKNAVKTEANTIAVLCDLEEAEMLRSVAQHFCPNALPQIEKAIRLAGPGYDGPPTAATREEIEQKMDDLAQKYIETHDHRIIKELYSLSLVLEKMKTVEKP